MSDPPPVGNEIGEEIDEHAAELLSRLLEMLSPQLSQVSEQTFGLAKWLLASLVTVNGGALVMIGGRGQALTPATATACGIWIIGIALALSSGLMAYRRGVRGAEWLGNLITQMHGTAITGRATVNFQAEADRIAQRNRHKNLPILVGQASLICFVLGAFVAGIGLYPG